MECINVTSMENKHAFRFDEGDEECNNGSARAQDEARRNCKSEIHVPRGKLKLECGPSDLSTKVANAGVGMTVRNDITFIKAEIKTDIFKKAFD